MQYEQSLVTLISDLYQVAGAITVLAAHSQGLRRRLRCDI